MYRQKERKKKDTDRQKQRINRINKRKIDILTERMAEKQQKKIRKKKKT